jgi:hypothetical protein
MVVCSYIWGKWKGIVENSPNNPYLVTLRVCLMEGDESKQIVTQCSMETMYNLFPPSKESFYSDNSFIEMALKRFFGPEEETSLQKWINNITPILIEHGIKQGLWSE